MKKHFSTQQAVYSTAQFYGIAMLVLILISPLSIAQNPIARKFNPVKDARLLRLLNTVTFKGGRTSASSTTSSVPSANRTVRNGRTIEVLPFDGSASGARETNAGQTASSESNGALCQSIPVTLTAGFTETNVLDPNSIEIWPGRVIRISSIDDGKYLDFRDNNNILPARKPMALAVIAAGTSERTVRETVQPELLTQGGITDAINRRKNEFGRNDFGSDTWLYEMYDYTSIEQFALEAGLGIVAVPINLEVRASAGYSTSVKKNKVVLKFFRKAYDVRIDTDINDLLQNPAASNDAGVIASVGYGSWGIVEIESDSSLSDIKAALDASFQVDPSVSVNASLSTEMKSTIASFSIKAIFKGVSGNSSVDPENVRSVDALRRILSNNAVQYAATTPVVPVSFVVKSINTGETMMLRTTMTYTKRDCVPLPDKPKPMDIRVKLVAFTCPQVNDGLTDDEDIYGKISIKASSKSNDFEAIWNKSISNLARVKKSTTPSEPGAYSLNGIASEYTFKMPTDEQGLANGTLSVEMDINDEEWGKAVPYEERTLRLRYRDIFSSIKNPAQFRNDNYLNQMFFLETNEKNNSNKIRLWFRVQED
jgi:hypothetical protein